MRKRVITFFALASLIIPLNIASASDHAKVDPTKAIQAAVNKCITPEQLDCLSSVSLVISGTKVLANQVSIDSDTETDSSGQITESGKSTWSYTSGGVSTNFTIDATLITPVYVVSGSNDEVDITEIDENADSEEDSETEASPKTEKVSLDTRYFEPKLDISISGTPANASVEVIVRTSWLQVQDAYLTARDSSVKLSAIKDGNEITLVGSQVNLYQQQKQKNQITGLIKTIITPIPTINFTLFHPKQADSSAACTKYGFRTTSTNGSSLSIADENAINSLLFNASGSTTKEDGTKNLGSALISIPLEWARCFYPNSNFGFGETFGVRVTSNLGAAKAQNVKSSAAIKGGILEVSVEGFEFAKTTILIETDAAKAAQRRADLANATAKAEADAKAKAQAEADARAKAEAEAKAKAEADAKAAAEKAAAEKAAAEKAAADLKAQQEAEAKAKAEAAVKSGSTKKITTITCVKGKLSKKVKGINPKCPSGFKKR